MMRLMKWFLVGVTFIVFAAVAYLVYCDVQYFQPSVKQYGRHIKYPSSVPKLLDTQYGPSLKYLVARVLTEDKSADSQIAQHSNFLLWGMFVDLHLTNEEQVNIIVSSTYLGAGVFGFEEASHHFFNKQLINLSPIEVALLVERSKAPSMYKKHPEKLEERANHLLKKAGYAY